MLLNQVANLAFFIPSFSEGKAPRSSPMFTLAEFEKSYQKLCQGGWLPSERAGSTGIGHTLERRLGLIENNLALPDWGQIEIKAHRRHSRTRLTCLTYDRQVWQMKPSLAVAKYGYPDEHGWSCLYSTLTTQPNQQGLFFDIRANTLVAQHLSGEVLAAWSLTELSNRFFQKMPALILVWAQSEMRGATEWFQYEEGWFLAQSTPTLIQQQFLAGHFLVDLRLHLKNGRLRNHGTGFRIAVNDLPALFQTKRLLSI